MYLYSIVTFGSFDEAMKRSRMISVISNFKRENRAAFHNVIKGEVCLCGLLPHSYLYLNIFRGKTIHDSYISETKYG
jgi:hypothetical protein